MNQRSPISEDVPPSNSPLTEPPRIGKGHPEYHFVQSLSELNRSIHQMDSEQKAAMARIETTLGYLKESVDSTKKKVEDLVRWKTMILGGAIVLGMVSSALFGLYMKFGDRITLAPSVTPSAPVVAPVQTPTKKQP